MFYFQYLDGGLVLGHNAITVDLVLANRITKQASANYNHKMKDLAVQVLDIISKEKDL